MPELERPNVYDSEAWVKFTADQHAVLVEENFHRAVLNYLNGLRDWQSNAPIFQAIGRPVPPLPVPPEGYTAPVIQVPPTPPAVVSPIGAISSDGPNIYFGNPLDQGPVGTRFKDPEGHEYVKIVFSPTPFGTQQRWLKLS